MNWSLKFMGKREIIQAELRRNARIPNRVSAGLSGMLGQYPVDAQLNVDMLGSWNETNGTLALSIDVEWANQSQKENASGTSE